jgi:hypothetical protein
MKTPRFHLALVLPLLLVFAQQGAMLHELGHIHADGSSEIRYEKAALAAKLCDTCAAFAQIGNPASASIAVLPAAAAAHHYVPEPVYSIVAAEAPPSRSRGPPRI